MTPFEAAGYTKDTVFRVTTDDEGFDLGTQVKLLADDGTDTPYFTNGSVYGFVKLHHLEHVSGPRKILMNREELTTLINEILDAREGLPSIPPDFIRWRGGERPVPFDTEVKLSCETERVFPRKPSPSTGMTITTRATLSRTAYLLTLVQSKPANSVHGSMSTPLPSSNRGIWCCTGGNLG